MRHLVGLGVAACLVLALGQAGMIERLGAHPFWAELTVPGLGILVGVGFYAVGKARFMAGLLLSLTLICLAAAAAHFGKVAFVASFGENARAGDLWFFGWIGLCGGIVAAAGLGLDRLVPGRRGA